MVQQKNLITIVIVAVIVGAVGFFAGTKYEQSQRSSLTQGGQTGFRQRGAGGGQNANARGVRGDIVSVDDQGITVKLADGSTKNVFLSTTTSITKASSAAKTDLKTGEAVMVFGQTNADGSVTAQSVSLNPQQFGRGDRLSTPSAQ